MRNGRVLGVTVMVMVFVSVAMAPIYGGNGQAAPAKINGTWSSVVVVPPNPILGNPVDFPLPELDTFSTRGTMVTSSSGVVLPLNFDSGFFLASISIGQGNWKFVGHGVYAFTQWRFVTDTVTGMQIGYMKILGNFSLVNRKSATGQYQVQMLGVDMTTPLTLGGEPAVLDGSFTLDRLPVEQLP